MGTYQDGLAFRPASVLGVETPASLDARVKKDDAIFRVLNPDIFADQKRPNPALSKEDFAAWKTWGKGWSDFRDDLDSYLSRLEAALGGTVEQLDRWEKELIQWYDYAEARGVRMSGPDPRKALSSGFARAVPWVLGLGAVGGVALLGMRYLRRGSRDE